MTQLNEARTQCLVDQLSKPDFVCVCDERFCIHWQVYAVKVLSPLLDSDSQAHARVSPSAAPVVDEGAAYRFGDTWIYEDDLPPDTTKALYDNWYERSRIVDGVRMGPSIERVAASPDIQASPDVTKYYCPEHEYNPPPNSGIALCPQCEILASEQSASVITLDSGGMKP